MQTSVGFLFLRLGVLELFYNLIYFQNYIRI